MSDVTRLGELVMLVVRYPQQEQSKLGEWAEVTSGFGVRALSDFPLDLVTIQKIHPEMKIFIYIFYRFSCDFTVQ